jgi:molybdopterin-containing oxidoreductase family iron-sulfur binding subunit
MACPYEPRSYNSTRPREYYPGQDPTKFEVVTSGQHPKGAIEKCNFCAPRLREGKVPACVATCPAEARILGDLDDPDSEVSRLLASGLARPRLEDQGTKPSVFYIELDPK